MELNVFFATSLDLNHSPGWAEIEGFLLGCVFLNVMSFCRITHSMCLNGASMCCETFKKIKS